MTQHGYAYYYLILWWWWVKESNVQIDVLQSHWTGQSTHTGALLGQACSETSYLFNTYQPAHAFCTAVSDYYTIELLLLLPSTHPRWPPVQWLILDSVGLDEGCLASQCSQGVILLLLLVAVDL